MESWQNRINDCKNEIIEILNKYECELIDDEQYGVLVKDHHSEKNCSDWVFYKNEVKKLKSFMDANFGKKVESHEIKNNLLILKFYGELDDCQVEKIQDNFNWIDGLEFDIDGEAHFSFDL